MTYYKLILRSNLSVIAGFALSSQQVRFFHAHETSIFIWF